ncbi:hypothetical protein [Streptomyces noursei]|uniref:hypothetical protein n=1 Tax=Streptomyces noursei TaxID=1971 RepID=UPI0023B86ACA|nr:hypothetical protein [Streptomyces noursei]
MPLITEGEGSVTFFDNGGRFEGTAQFPGEGPVSYRGAIQDRPRPARNTPGPGGRPGSELHGGRGELPLCVARWGGGTPQRALRNGLFGAP